jgi:uncharacterized protein (DUF1697 family)
MATLKLALEEAGFSDVKTYINSGNVILSSDKPKQAIADQIEALLPAKYKLDSELIKILVLSHEELKTAVEKAPDDFAVPGKYHSDVIFLIDISVADALKVFDPRPDVDRIWPGSNVIYSRRLSAERTKSRLSKIVGTKAYKSMTIRTFGTVTKLLKLLDETRSYNR